MAKVGRPKGSVAALTEKDRLCVEYWFSSPEVSKIQAYLKYHPKCSKKTAQSSASRFFSRVAIKRYIAEREEKETRRFEVEKDWVIFELVDNVKRCKQAEPVLDSKGKPTGEYRFDAAGANKAQELLGRHLKMFTDRIETTDPLKERLAAMSDAELLAELERLRVSDEVANHLAAMGLNVQKATKTTH